MSKLYQDIIVATFAILLSSTLGVVAFTYLKIEDMDRRLIRIESAVKFNHPATSHNNEIASEAIFTSREY